MPKITGTGTPSAVVPVPPQEFDQGKFFNQGEKDDDLSPGSNLPPSGEIKQKTPDKPKTTGVTRKPARTTENPSK